MSKLPKQYLFATSPQWGAGLTSGGRFGASGLAPAPEFAAAPQLVWAGDAYAPAAAATGEVYWRSATGVLYLAERWRAAGNLW